MNVEEKRGSEKIQEAAQIAVFVDCENVSSQLAWEALGRFEAHGKIGYVELVGDSFNLWSTERFRKYYAARVTYVPCERKGGQAADLTLVIAVMNNLGSSTYSTYAIISSDQDFYPLIVDLKSKCKTVLTAGERKTSKVYRNVADAFIELGGPISDRRLTEDDERLLRVIESACRGGWIDLSALGKLLRIEISDFSPKRFGARNLSALLRLFPSHVEVARLGSSESDLYCRYLKKGG